MPRIACVMMQRDETFLLRPWLAYHGYLFGYENLFVLDNGSTAPDVRDALAEHARKGVHVDWTHASRQDYLAKGALIGEAIQALDATGRYDFLIPLDCDEFILLRTGSDFVCSREPILTYFRSLIGERRTLRIPYQFANHPLDPDIYHHFGFVKIFFASGGFAPIDHGHHMTEHRGRREPKDTRLVHLHFHHQRFDLKARRARRSWIGTADPDDRESLAHYNGPSAHLSQFFLADPDQYYRGFLNMVHFYLPRFRALLSELGAPIALPSESIAEDLRIRVTEAEALANSEQYGAVMIVPLTGQRDAAPAAFRASRFHEEHYLEANADLAESGVDPTSHYCIHGFREGRPLRPVTDRSVLDGPAVHAVIANWLASPVRTLDGKQCLELGANGDSRPSGWLVLDLRPIGKAVKLDVTRPLAIADASFDYIYARNIIEQLRFDAGRFLLRECFRLLRPGGTIRIMTASIEFPIGLFAPNRAGRTDDHVAWASETVSPAAGKSLPSFAFNHFVFGRGHRFLYDRPTLAFALTEAGFADLTEAGIGASRHPSLRDLETVDHDPDELPPWGSIILEGTRPLASPRPWT